MKSKLEKFIEDNRSAFDDRVPGADVLARIQQRMGHTETAPAKKGIVVSFKTIRWAAAACVIVLAGIGLWWMNIDSNISQEQLLAAGKIKEQENKIQDTRKQVGEDTRDQVTREQAPTTAVFATTKTDQRKEMLFASLGNMESASTRIAAAMKAYDLKNADKDIVDALLHTMNSDPNTNVRLAALEALAKFHGEPYVKKQLTAALKKQKDPMVQVELIRVLTNMKQTSILTELEKLVKDVNTSEAVKDRAYTSILTLGS
ncbi:HEAT repeat domain-containing protein [Dolichospermum sp. ST_sed9]|nr:HEAT repeat domain-containing protein [Dolichospermum sp. ST_sed9]